MTKRYKKLSTTKRVGIAIFDYMQRSGGMSPTIRDIGSMVMGDEMHRPLSTSVVNYHLGILEERGVIERKKEATRGITIVGATYMVPDWELSARKLR